MVKAFGAVTMAAVAAWSAAATEPVGAVVLAQAQITEAGRAALQEFAKGAPTVGTPGLTAPKVLTSSNPKYTPDELRAKTEGTVVLHAIIGTDGRVERSQVWRSLNSALDAQALEALSTWVFAPGRLNDAPTRVAVEVQMSFKVHKD